MVVLVPTLDTPTSKAERSSADAGRSSADAGRSSADAGRRVSNRRTRTLRVLIASLIAVAAFCFPSGSVDARSEPLAASSVKAAFVYQFANFVEWPEASFENISSPLKIGVAGDDELLEALRKIVVGKKIGLRSVEIVANGVLDDDFHDCHILFNGANDQKSLAAYIKRQNGSAILAVSDSPSFTRDGGIIRLFDADKKIGIEINIDAAERAHLRISSKLLRLATVVHDVVAENP